jgi:uncharacterized membrane protein YfcA
LWELVAGAVLSAVAGVVTGLTGFGYVLAFAPGMLWIESSKRVILGAILIGLVLSGWVVWHARGDLKAGDVVLALGAAGPGVPIGSWVLAQVSVQELRVMVNVLAILLGVTWLATRSCLQGARGRPWLVPAAAFVGGVLNAATGMGTAPVALAVALQKWSVDRGRGLLAAFNLFTYALALVGASLMAVAEAGVLGRALVWIGPGALGVWVGGKVARWVSAELFPLVLVVVVIGCSGVALASLLAMVSRS